MCEALGGDLGLNGDVLTYDDAANADLIVGLRAAARACRWRWG